MMLLDRCFIIEVGLVLLILMTDDDCALAALITVRRRRVPLSISGERESVPAEEIDAASLRAN